MTGPRAAGRLALALTLTLGAGAAAAAPPKSSPIPRPRPAAAAPTVKPAVAATAGPAGRLSRRAPARSLHPRPRPEARAAASGPAPSGPSTPRSKPSTLRPGNRKIAASEREGAGWICGDRAIQGTRITTITSPVPGCGIAAPVRVTAVSGIELDSPAVLNCPTARALNRWVRSGLKPNLGHGGGGLVRLTIAASYACRPRDNIKGKKISEHGKGNAIDIAAFTLANGTTLSVLDDFRRTRWMQRAYAAACGIFGTTLGPNSDSFHRNHFHFDTAQYRGGPYCR